MPTLDELRRWARGEAIDGLPPIGSDKAAEPSTTHSKTRSGRVLSTRGGSRYKLNADGTDAILQFGREFRGETVSRIIATARGRKYLAWIIGQDFDKELKAACQHQLELHKRGY